MNRKRIVFASMLKTVTDIRTYHKLARSLAAVHKYEIFIIGFPSAEQIDEPDVTFISLPKFSRLSTGRLNAYRFISSQLEELKPDLLIINTHELLRTAVKIKDLTGCKLIYDIRENYFHNLIQDPIFRIMAGRIRRKETRLSRHVDKFILAERTYADELKFLNKNYIILENKALTQLTESKNTIEKRLIYTGTLSKRNGLFKAIQMAEALRAVDSDITLQITGNSFNRKILDELRTLSGSRDWLKLNISEAPLPYSMIADTIRSAWAGFVIYEDEPGVYDKMPTKLYEYIAAEVPVILDEKSPWAEFCRHYPAAITWNGSSRQMLESLLKNQFYKRKPGDEVLWKQESERLISCVDSLI